MNTRCRTAYRQDSILAMIHAYVEYQPVERPAINLCAALDWQVSSQPKLHRTRDLLLSWLLSGAIEFPCTGTFAIQEIA